MHLPFSLPFKVKEARFRYIALPHFSLDFFKKEGGKKIRLLDDPVQTQPMVAVKIKYTGR